MLLLPSLVRSGLEIVRPVSDLENNKLNLNFFENNKKVGLVCWQVLFLLFSLSSAMA